MYFNMVGSEVLKYDCEVTEVIDCIKDDYYEKCTPFSLNNGILMILSCAFYFGGNATSGMQVWSQGWKNRQPTYVIPSE